MLNQQIIWMSPSREIVVLETEHLFGVDYILARVNGGSYMPVSIITRPEPIVAHERRFARRWGMAYEDGDYAIMNSVAQTLQQIGRSSR